MRSPDSSRLFVPPCRRGYKVTWKNIDQTLEVSRTEGPDSESLSVGSGASERTGGKFAFPDQIFLNAMTPTCRAQITAHITHGSAGFHTVQTPDHDLPSQPIRTGTERLTFGRTDRGENAAEFLFSGNAKAR